MIAYRFSYSIGLRARQLTAVQTSCHFSVPISQPYRHPEFRILVLYAHYQITESTEYRPRDTLRTQCKLYLLGRIVGLSKFGMR